LRVSNRLTSTSLDRLQNWKLHTADCHRLNSPRSLTCTLWHFDPSTRWATTDMGRKWGLCAPLRGGESRVYLRSKWYLGPSTRLTTTDMGRKWGMSPFLGWGTVCPLSI